MVAVSSLIAIAAGLLVVDKALVVPGPDAPKWRESLNTASHLTVEVPVFEGQSYQFQFYVSKFKAATEHK